MTRLLHEAGVPPAVLQLTPADGPPFGEVALTHPVLAGVAFTGSTATASTINRTLANRAGAIVPLIAETGGVNAMVVDATALPEQVVDDALTSAFTSAGQRCSALRVLYLQEEVAERVTAMLIGAMRELKIGPPQELSTDVGPVIGEAARARLSRHVERMRREAQLLYATSSSSGGSTSSGARSSAPSCTLRATAAISCRRCSRRSAAPGSGSRSEFILGSRASPSTCSARCRWATPT